MEYVAEVQTVAKDQETVRTKSKASCMLPVTRLGCTIVFRNSEERGQDETLSCAQLPPEERSMANECPFVPDVVDLPTRVAIIQQDISCAKLRVLKRMNILKCHVGTRSI